MRPTLLAALLVLTATTGLGAADAPPKAERVTFRVLGLFAPWRVADLRESFARVPETITLVDLNYDEAELTVEFVPGKAFPGAKPEQWAERLDQHIRNASRDNYQVRPRRDVPKEKLAEVVIPAGACDCKGCSLAAYESISRIEGVDRATVDFKGGKVVARIDPAKTNREALEEALRKKGVKVPPTAP